SEAGGRGGVGGEPARSRHAVGALACGDGRHPGGYGNAATVRGCARRGSQRPAAARRARPAVSATAGIRRRTTLIAETGPGLSPGRHLWRAFSPLGAARRQRGHLSFTLVPRAKLVPYPVSLRLVFAVARGPMIVALRPAVFDRYALALNETGFPQAIAACARLIRLRRPAWQNPRSARRACRCRRPAAPFPALPRLPRRDRWQRGNCPREHCRGC